MAFIKIGDSADINAKLQALTTGGSLEIRVNNTVVTIILKLTKEEQIGLNRAMLQNFNQK